MDDQELSSLIRSLRTFGGDLEAVEVKKAQGGLPKSLRETLSAFSNTEGGLIMLGLDEKSGFSASGIADPSKMAGDLASLCSTEMDPPLRPLIQIKEFEGAALVIAEIPVLEPSRRPCYYRGSGMTQGSYVRVHDGDRHLSAYEVQMMLSNRGQPKEDESAVPGSDMRDLSEEMVAPYCARLRSGNSRIFGDKSVADLLRLTRVTTDQGECTMAGLLALGSYPQEYFPQLTLTFVHYPTADGSAPGAGPRFIDNASISGPIPMVVGDALAVLRRNMARRSTVRGAGRRDSWEYPETALREAIANALIHRDYSETSRGTQVQVEMYPDRLVVRNPGGLFGPVTVESLFEGSMSSSRNARLLKILEDVAIPNEVGSVCENRGSGIREMLNSLRTAGMTTPSFQDKISSFTVVFPNHALLSDETVQWIDSLNERGLTENQCIGLAMMRDGKILDNPTYRSATGIDSRLATADLQDLVAKELATQEGDRRWAKYRLAKGLAKEHSNIVGPSRRAPADRRAEILLAMGEETYSRAELAAKTGLDNQVVRSWLRKLRDEGAVRLAAPGTSVQSKNTRYVAVPGAIGRYQDPLSFEEE